VHEHYATHIELKSACAFHFTWDWVSQLYLSSLFWHGI